MQLQKLLSELGYRQSPFFRESGDRDNLTIVHVLRDARRTNVKGTYFIRRLPGDAETRRDRPAVHVAEADTPEAARKIHRHLWNQGITPFLVVSLPEQVRVYTPFAYDEQDETVGHIETVNDSMGLSNVAERLAFLRAESIDSGEIWRTKGAILKKDGRVDRVLLNSLRALSHQLVRQHGLKQDVAHALVGRFVYLHYLRERDILSDRWLAGVPVQAESIFSSDIRLSDFRRLTEAVDERFSGRIFPINWNSSEAPNGAAVRAAARAFAGEEVDSAQIPLFRPFDFEYIPIELLSAIYEQFLHDEGEEGADQGAFYTSEPVADYLLAQMESVRPLGRGMKVLDPCCGSGIFLVLAFRRLIEQELHRQGTEHLPPSELRRILTESIFGVERNAEACLVTEFSLILTLLSYIDPPELHRYTNFKFPTLHNEQVFEADFFSNKSGFWQKDLRFDWIVGNPPWLELDPKDKAEQPAIAWIEESNRIASAPVARFRTSEAFSWRVAERLAADGLVGLITQATSLTNDQSMPYRKAFFSRNTIYRVTNFSNLAYILFESAEEPAATVVFSTRPFDNDHIVHFGPLVVNQAATAPIGKRKRTAPWVITICESEIQMIEANEAARGEATTWKRALWGNSRDHRALARLRKLLPKTLGNVASERKWALNLGLQLRGDKGTRSDPNEEIIEVLRRWDNADVAIKEVARSFGALNVVEPGQFSKAVGRLSVSPKWLVKNRWGTYVRSGRYEGFKIIRAPHLLIWNEFAAFSDQDFIFRHPRVGLAGPRADTDWLKAVSIICTSSITAYFLFLDLSAGWGISRSTIDLGDARQIPMPALNSELVKKLARLHSQFASQETQLASRTEWQRELDASVASILDIPGQLMSLAREFREYRLPLIKGKAPTELTRIPDRAQLERYGVSLKRELDDFLKRKSRRHGVEILCSAKGIVATIELRDAKEPAAVRVLLAGVEEDKSIEEILRAAEKTYGQWVYVRRSVRIFAGKKVHVCKPAKRLEWTETQALLDASDIIAEVAESQVRM
jgi:hypothetical protein